MNEEKFTIQIGKREYKVLEEIAQLLDLQIKDLVRLALQEFFDFVNDDTFVFLESVGLVDKLKNACYDSD
ncbi:MAG: hypothetical protein BAJALOKI3v1_620004 [Promethearchaeota archaeon]|jgi:hypothetical protein|nr:MAG: hypothetical protein BAJALOKI3v1_620004 [Candidatus Lokiarchaeota archaeon]